MNTRARCNSRAARAVLVTLVFCAALVPGQAYCLANAAEPSSALANAPASALAAAPAIALAAADPPAGGAAPAQADPPAGATAPAAPTGTVQAGAAPAAPAGSPSDLNFDLFDEGKKADAGPSPAELARRQAIERQAKIRRPMLQAHQAMGFATLAALTATVVIGHLHYYDQYQSGDFSGRYSLAHEGLGIGTSILFGTTGLLAVFAPNPYPKPIRLDTALIHKISMILATAGMVTQVILGPVTASRAGRLDQGSLALGHLITGYATWAFMATGTIVYFF